MSELTDREKAKKMYVDSKGSIPLVDIAEKLDIPDGTIRVWKSRYKWDNDIEGASETLQKKKCNATRSVTMKEAKQELDMDKAKEDTKRIVKNNELTPQRKKFCLYYIEDFNATKAYQKAYEVDYMTANANGSRLLVSDSIKQEIERLTESVVHEQLVTSKLLSKRLLEQLMKIAFADITDFIYFGVKEVELEDRNIEVNYVDFMDSHLVDGQVISEIKQGKEGVGIKLQDKLKAIDMLLKYYVRLDEEDIEMKKEMFKTKLDKEKAQTEKIQAEINRLTGNDTDIEDLTYLRELVLEDETD